MPLMQQNWPQQSHNKCVFELDLVSLWVSINLVIDSSFVPSSGIGSAESTARSRVENPRSFEGQEVRSMVTW